MVNDVSDPTSGKDSNELHDSTWRVVNDGRDSRFGKDVNKRQSRIQRVVKLGIDSKPDNNGNALHLIILSVETFIPKLNGKVTRNGQLLITIVVTEIKHPNSGNDVNTGQLM